MHTEGGADSTPPLESDGLTSGEHWEWCQRVDTDWLLLSSWCPRLGCPLRIQPPLWEAPTTWEATKVAKAVHEPGTQVPVGSSIWHMSEAIRPLWTSQALPALDICSPIYVTQGPVCPCRPRDHGRQWKHCFKEFCNGNVKQSCGVKQRPSRDLPPGSLTTKATTSPLRAFGIRWTGTQNHYLTPRFHS
jgi:hypothetical protein